MVRYTQENQDNKYLYSQKKEFICYIFHEIDIYVHLRNTYPYANIFSVIAKYRLC